MVPRAKVTLRGLLPSLALSILVACGSDDASPVASIKVYKHRGSVQCGDRGTPPEVMRRGLTDAGITVLSYSCGHDGLVRAAVCGISDGFINIFEIPASQADGAVSLSFLPLTALATAAEVPCP